MAKVLILSICLLTSGFVSSQNFPDFEKKDFKTSYDTLQYRLLHPENPEPRKTYPLILFLHGAGERGSDNEVNLKYLTGLFLNENNRMQYPAYVLVPQCPENESWTPSDWFAKPNEPIATVVELMDSLVKNFPIDTTRKYVMGLSMGGYGTWYLITRYPNTYAAAVPICGGGDWNQAQVLTHIPIWVFHGKKDEVVLPEQSRKMVQAIKKAGGKPCYTEYKKVGHDSWTPALKEPELLPWMFGQVLSPK